MNFEIISWSFYLLHSFLTAILHRGLTNCFFLTAILHRGLRNCFFFWTKFYFPFLFGFFFSSFSVLFSILFYSIVVTFWISPKKNSMSLLFPYSIWTFISFLYLDFFTFRFLPTYVLFLILFLFLDLRGSTELDKKD